MKRNSFCVAFLAIAASPGRSCIALLAIGISLGLIDTSAIATPINLVDQDSSVTIDPTSQAGVDNWTVDGVNQLYQEWFWYGIGSSGDSPINTLAPGYNTAWPQQFDCDLLRFERFECWSELCLDRISSGSGQSVLSEAITLTNNSSFPMDLHFFEYSNFTLNGSTSGESVSFPNANAVDVQNGLMSLTETVATPAANEWEGDYYPTMLNELNSNSPTTLLDTPAIGARRLGPAT